MTRFVLDTNVLVSALLFRSAASGLFDTWRRGRFRIAVSAPILDEYRRVLAYPRFGLSEQEAEDIMDGFVLPYCDRYEPHTTPRICSDPDDDKFFHCATASRADVLVSGDRAVLALGPRHGRTRILSLRQTLDLLSR